MIFKRVISLIFLLCFVSVFSARAQEIAQQTNNRISGCVTDVQGAPLPGVSVHLAGGNISYFVLTDAEGLYSIQVPDLENAELEFSFVGMERQTVKAAGRKSIDVVLSESNIQLDDVVITGYQTLNRRELSSAVTHVKLNDIAIDGAMSIDQMLAGQVSGMAVTQTSGSPGASPRIRVRGTSSIIGNKAPLWVLDGIILDDPVEVDHSDLMGDDAEYLVGNAISGINPSDIESITVLKDASATAIYGIQAANGVIVVSTKRGKAGKPRVSYSGTVSVQQRDNYNRLNLMSAYDRINLSHEIIDAGLHYERPQASLTMGYEGLLNRYESKDLTTQEFHDELIKMIDRNTDWFDVLYRNAVTQSHALSINGGNDRTTYYASLGFDKQPGTAREEEADRFTLMTKINSWLHKKVYLGLQINASLSENKGYHTSVNPRTYAYETARTIPLYNDDGSLFYYVPYTSLGSGRDALTFNVLDEIANSGSDASIANITSKLNFQWDIWDGLKYELQASYIYSRTERNSWANADSHYVAEIRGYSRNYNVLINSDEWNESPLPQGGTLDYNT